MTAVKEKIIGAITVMTDADAEYFWELIEKIFSVMGWHRRGNAGQTDIQMLETIKNDPECHEFTREQDIVWN